MGLEHVLWVEKLTKKFQSKTYDHQTLININVSTIT